MLPSASRRISLSTVLIVLACGLVVVSAMLTRTSCDEASGPATFMHFDNHVVGCHVSGGGACSSSEVKFIDDNRTVYAVTSGTMATKVVPATATCADVRAAFPM